MKAIALIVVLAVTCFAITPSVLAASARAAERKALTIAEASCASKGIKYSPNPPHISLKGERWYISWDFVEETSQSVLAVVDSDSWKSHGCVPIGIWHGSSADLRDAKPN